MILIDTNVLVALADRLDDHHRRAVDELGSVYRRGLLLCWPVFTESFHFLPRIDQREFLQELITQFQMRLLETSAGPTANELFPWLVRYGEHIPDLADAYLVLLSASNRRWRVWSWDSEFRTVWRRPDGTPVPMAIKA